MVFLQRVCFILYSPVYCGIIGLWWAFPSWKRKPTASFGPSLVCYKLRMNVASGSPTCDLQENLTSLLGGRYGQKSIRTGFFLIPLMSLNCNLFMSEQFSRNNQGASLVCVFYSCHCNCFLTAWSSSLRVGGGVFRGSTRRIWCTSQDLHLNLFLFFCVRGIRTRNS